MTHEEHEEDIAAISTIVGSEALTKACYDPFDYALKLRTGEVIAFTEAKVINSEWIHIEVQPRDNQPFHNRLPFPAIRGMDIRLADIVWVMDAPSGS